MTKYLTASLVCAVIMSGAAYQSAFAQKRAQHIINMLQKKYETFDDFSADLLQIQEFLFSEAQDTTEQKIALLKQDYFKIETAEITLVTDGKIIKEYNRYEQKITIDEIDNTSPNTYFPREFLFEFPERYVPVDFRQETRSGSRGFTLVMEPKKPDEEIIQTLEVWVDAADSLVKYIRYADFNDNENIYILSNIQIDRGLIPEYFELRIPDGVTVKTVDLRRKKGND